MQLFFLLLLGGVLEAQPCWSLLPERKRNCLSLKQPRQTNIFSRLRTAVISQDMLQTLSCVEKVLSPLHSSVPPSETLTAGTVLTGGFQLSHAGCHHLTCWRLQLSLKNDQTQGGKS